MRFGGKAVGTALSCVFESLLKETDCLVEIISLDHIAVFFCLFFVQSATGSSCRHQMVKNCHHYACRQQRRMGWSGLHCVCACVYVRERENERMRGSFTIIRIQRTAIITVTALTLAHEHTHILKQVPFSSQTSHFCKKYQKHERRCRKKKVLGLT